jgi:hypothetical protein
MKPNYKPEQSKNYTGKVAFKLLSRDVEKYIFHLLRPYSPNPAVLALLKNIWL